MKWLFRGLMAVSVIGAGLISAGVIPVGFAALFTALGGAAGLFHDVPGSTPATPAK